jgi:transposase InsO family protein/predicted aspartyl protease
LFKLDHINKIDRIKTCSSIVTLLINGRRFTLELDTGSTNTIISEQDWKKIGSPSIHPSKYKLKCYSGQMLQVKGECEVNVNHGKQNFILSMIVVHGNSLPLLGLEWIKSLKLDMNSIVHGSNYLSSHIHKLSNQTQLEALLIKYKGILNNELGHCTKVQAHIRLKPDTIPKFFKPRPIPFSYLEGVKDEIKRNVDAGILQKIETSAWAAPIVPVKKPNGKTRICGDFKVTINPQMWVDQHPIPSVDELLTRLNNGQKFTKLDLSDAYLQIELDEDSKKLVVINTPLGLYRYNRMPFGIANAPAVFQRIMDQVIAGIPNCVAYLDDILITGAHDEEHLQTLEAVLAKLAEFNLRCNPDKCSFFKDEVSYLGFVIDKNGKRPDTQRVEAIINMPPPSNLKELEAFIGKVNYYGKFIPNFSDKCEPLNRLRRNNIPWKWNRACQDTFDNLKNDISTATTLEHFDTKLPLVLATDASNYGIGAVIMHRHPDGSERPIAHASKTLTSAEKNYSQIEKEALSIVYGVKKFHQYLAGRHFELFTDHQPLLAIFNPSKGIPVMTANRLQRWALCLMAYSYTIRYKPSLLHANADALSRLPAGPDPCFVDKDSFQINLIQDQLVKDWPVQSNEIEIASSKDEILGLIIKFTMTKWPPSISKTKQPELIPYYNNRHCLSVLKGCLLKDNQVVIPKQLQRRVLLMLHRSHLGTVKMKQLARSHCWWPNIDNDILEMTRACSTCSKLQPMPKQQFNEWPEPTQVWSRVHMDFAGPTWGSKWLVMVDAKSKFPFVADMGNNTTATKLCDVLEHVIDWFGPPEILVSDNGPPFNSHEMKQFYKYYGITHLTTAPYHPASNGLAERFVRTFKDGLEKEKQSGQSDKYKAVRNILRTYRWSIHTSTGHSPADMILQHPIRTALHRLKPVDSNSLQQQQQQPSRYNVGQLVITKYNQPNTQRCWQSGMVTNKLGSMLYEIQLSDGQIVKRHQNQLRPQFSSITQASDISSLPDDILNKSSTKPQHSQRTSTPRYPRRIHRPPQRYTPT